MTSIRLEDVRFGWRTGQVLLDIPELAIQRGERVLLRGPSGSGKSTLLGLIGGVLKPHSGTVSILDKEISRLGAADRDRFRGEHLGFIFQMFNLIPYLTVLENVLLPMDFSPARRQRLLDANPRAEAIRLLEALGLSGDLQHRAPAQLSIGQQQRVAAARALMGRPEIIVADEPTSSLDADARSAFLDLLMSECRSIGASLLFVSHDPALETHFDRSLSLSDVNHASGSQKCQ